MQSILNISDVNADRVHLRALIVINSQHHIFEEHFPEMKIVPGAVIVGFIAQCIKVHFWKYTGISSFITLKKIVFLKPLLSHCYPRIDLSISGKAGYAEVKFIIEDETGRFCQGVFQSKGES
ncbi:hypothetical protein [Rahnella aceris]|jgi:3-hydroxymyristoyl/3-hydroxydecanoyl-(acyl carrier protein) dehydratase|uniref:hypothetical protein n=1 Tax=Rahnella sp. (strain Y9602) TaxID=2703885 RepID=UPI003BA2F5A1